MTQNSSIHPSAQQDTCPHGLAAPGASPLGAVDPGHGDVLQEHHNGERQAGRVVVKHGHKVVAGALDEQQAQEEGDDAAHH